LLPSLFQWRLSVAEKWRAEKFGWGHALRQDGVARSEAEGEEQRVPSGRCDRQIRAELADMEDEEDGGCGD